MYQSVRFWRSAAATVGNAYEPLTRYDEKLQPQPMLAESWDLSTELC